MSDEKLLDSYQKSFENLADSPGVLVNLSMDDLEIINNCLSYCFMIEKAKYNHGVINPDSKTTKETRERAIQLKRLSKQFKDTLLKFNAL